MPKQEGSTCTYTHQLDGDEWMCPHSAPDDKHCIFHKPAPDTTSTEIRNTILQVLRTEPNKLEFVGAKIPELDLQHFLIDIDNQATIDFRDIEVTRNVCLDYLTARHPLDFRGAEVGGDVEVFNTDLESGFRAARMRVDGGCRIVESKFSKRVNFNYLNIDNDLVITETQFERQVSFDGVDIGDKMEVEDTQFGRWVSLCNTKFGTSVRLSPDNFPELQLDVKNPPDNGRISLAKTTIESGSIIIDQASEPIPVYDCTGATIGSVDLVHSVGNVFPYLWLEDTKFDDFDFNKHAGELRRLNFDIHSNKQENAQADGGRKSIDHYNSLSVVYSNAADGARKTGATNIASEFKFRKRFAQKKAHLVRLYHPNSTLELSSTVIKLVSNFTEEMLTGYGERPNRTIFSGINIILMFSILYWEVGTIDRTETIVSSLTLSFETMLGFIIGTPDIANLSSPVEVLINFQALIGFILFGVIFASIIGDSLS